MDILDLFFYLSRDEQELLMFKYKDKMAMKFAISRLLDKAVKQHCEDIKNSDEWYYKDSEIEHDEESAS